MKFLLKLFSLYSFTLIFSAFTISQNIETDNFEDVTNIIKRISTDNKTVRVVSYNVNAFSKPMSPNFVPKAGQRDGFAKTLSALRPDVILFQEIKSEESIKDYEKYFLRILPASLYKEANLPSNNLQHKWYVAEGFIDVDGSPIKNMTISRFPFIDTSVDTVPGSLKESKRNISGSRGILLVNIDLPNLDFTHDLYTMNVHLKCCDKGRGEEDTKRTHSLDAALNWIRDAVTKNENNIVQSTEILEGAGKVISEEVNGDLNIVTEIVQGTVKKVTYKKSGNIDLPKGTPIIFGGDFNLVGSKRVENSFLGGDIQNEELFGTDPVVLSWDSKTKVQDSLVNLKPKDLVTEDDFTYLGTNKYPPSALDRLFMPTGSVGTVINSFVFNPATLTKKQQSDLNVTVADSLKSDHLPIVVDLQY